MKKVVAWLVAGAISAALTLLLMMALKLGAPPLYPGPALVRLHVGGGEVFRLAWDLLWGALYGAFFHLAMQHLLPKKSVPAGLLFALLLFLLADLVWPLLERRGAVTSPAELLRSALEAACFSLVMVLLGKQMEK